MAIKKKNLEANNLKRQENTLHRNSVHTDTVEQRTIAHSNQSLTNTSKSNPQKSKIRGQINDSASAQNHSLQVNNTDKLFSQKNDNSFVKSSDESQKITNASESKAKIFSSVSSVSSITKDATTDAFKKGVQSYKGTLESNDLGVKVAGQTLTGASKSLKISKRTFNLLKDANTNKMIRADNLSAIKNIQTNIQETKDSIKLVKKNRELGQASKELKVKKIHLKSQKAELKTKKGDTNRNFAKNITAPFSVASKKVGSTFQNQLEQDDSGVQVASQGSTLVKQSVASASKARQKLKTAKTVGNVSKGKLNARSTKLKEKTTTVKKVTTNKQLQKKKIKKNIALKKRKSSILANITSAIGKTNATLINSIKKISVATIKKAILGKAALAVSGSLPVLIPVFFVLGLFILIIAMFGAGESQQQPSGGTGISQNLSPEVEKWRELVTTEATAQGMENYTDLTLALIQVESGGRGTRDIMQSAESAGYPRNYYQTEVESVRQGISYLKSIVTILQGFDNGFENNARLIAQSYNFGSPFARYVGNRGGTYDLTVAEDYSRTVVAPSLGNTTGATNPYVNEISKSFGKTYLYNNGGNFFYGELVGQYIGRAANIEGDFAIVLAEIEKYNGWEYVWGGKSPSVGFDCSGLVAWGLKQIGINLPSPASLQYDMTVSISEAEAQPGDLIFFRGTYGGPNHVSHVGFYIDANTMYDANGSGVGYHDWKSSYWQSFKPEIRRVVQ